MKRTQKIFANYDSLRHYTFAAFFYPLSKDFVAQQLIPWVIFRLLLKLNITSGSAGPVNKDENINKSVTLLKLNETYLMLVVKNGTYS